MEDPLLALFLMGDQMEFIDGKMNIDYMKRKYTNTSLASINIDNDDNNDNKNKEDLK